MSFVSYAQNFEDVMLWRALRHVENGTYVDVGAQDPVVDSVSRAFYEHGWRGVHVEPVPFYAERLRQDRPGETVLQAALGETSGTLALTVIAGTGLSTAVDRHSQRHHDAGFETEVVQVPMLTLTSALGMLAGRDVHWLKIDVEGFEEAVLRGWDSTALRPWVMVIEATIPGSSETDYDRWDPIVIAAGYRFVYFDGLNRFYIANEHVELAAAFASPPNVFDGVELSGLSSWGLYHRVAAQSHDQVAALGAALDDERAALAASQALLAEQEMLLTRRDGKLAEYKARLAHCETQLAGHAATARFALVAAQSAELAAQVGPLRQEIDAARQRLAETEALSHHWWTVADHLNHKVLGLYASTSWRITAPFRALREVAASVPTLGPSAGRWISRRVRIAGRPLLLWTVRYVLDHPGLQAGALRMLTPLPRLKHYLRRFALRAGLIEVPVEAAMAPDTEAIPDVLLPPAALGIVPPAHLGPRAGRIYGQLKRQSS